MKVQLFTTLGDILLELDQARAPKTIENFLAYVNSGHYAGTIFHRVIEDFMIQGGGLDADMNIKTTLDPLENEADNGLSNLEGTVAMARTMDPHSASAQFFINTTDNPFLDHKEKTEDGWGYCVFAKVIEGMDVVEKIEEAPTTLRSGYQDVPEDVILIERIELVND
jgi:peptidyl-prolyl cis-trans isomerase B (cyclophilin B)